MSELGFEQVIQQGVALQQRFPGEHLAAVGGTAASLHAEHRYSLDVDCVTPSLRDRYLEFSERLESWAGWRTNRKNPPVLILGEREGVELGVRQLRRGEPLRVTELRGLTVPTLDEILRIKAFLLSERRGTRDYVDFAALAEKAGAIRTLRAIGYLNQLYSATGSQTTVTRFAEACEAEPADFAAVRMADYKGLRAPFNDWPFVRESCRRIGRGLLKLELSDALPAVLDERFG